MKDIFKKVLGKSKRISVLSFAVMALMMITAQAAFASPAPEDTPVDMSAIELPFSILGMLGTATNFLAMYGPWILLALGVIFSPVLYGLALKLVSYIARRFATK